MRANNSPAVHPIVVHSLAQENFEVKTKYNELLQKHQELQKELEHEKMKILPAQDSEFKHYQKTIQALQIKNAELDRIITNKPNKVEPAVQSSKIIADNPKTIMEPNKSRCFHYPSYPYLHYSYPSYSYPYPSYSYPHYPYLNYNSD